MTSLVALAGVGVAMSGTMLEMLRQSGKAAGRGIDAIRLAIAAVLLPAAGAVPVFGKSRHKGTLDRR